MQRMVIRATLLPSDFVDFEEDKWSLENGEISLEYKIPI